MMSETVIPAIVLTVGNFVIFGILPFAIVTSIALVWLGVVRKSTADLVAGAALPFVTLVVGIAMRTAVLGNPSTSASVAASAGSMESVLPLSIGLATVAFLLKMLPAIVRAHRAERAQ